MRVSRELSGGTKSPCDLKARFARSFRGLKGKYERHFDGRGTGSCRHRCLPAAADGDIWPRLDGGRHAGFVVFVALAQVPGYALAAYGVEVWGRRPTLIGFCLLVALGCLFFVISPSDMLVGASLLMMSFALLGTWGALYAYTPELYPTASRATGMGAAGAMVRLGGLIAPSLMAFVVSEGLGVLSGSLPACWLSPRRRSTQRRAGRPLAERQEPSVFLRNVRVRPFGKSGNSPKVSYPCRW